VGTVDYLVIVKFHQHEADRHAYYVKKAVIRHIECALLSSLSSMVMLGPGVTQVMGEDLTALRVFAWRNGRGVPVRAIVL
jgi:hypothetical protein